MSFGDFFIDMSMIIKKAKIKKRTEKLIFLIPKDATVFKISNKILNEVLHKIQFSFMLYSLFNIIL